MSTKKKKSPLWPVWLLLKIAVVFAIFVGIGVTILANVGGNSDALKTIIEDYASDATGFDTTIGKLNNMSFFPTVGVDFEDLKMVKPGTDTAMASADTIVVRIGFWDVAKQSGKIKDIGITNLNVAAGIATKDALSIQSISIVDNATETDKAQLVLKGKIGSKPLLVNSTLAAYGTGNNRKYDMGKDRAIDVTAGDIKASGFMASPSLSKINLTDFTVSKAGARLVAGDLTIQSKGSGRHIEGKLLVGNGSEVEPDVVVGAGSAKGTVTSDKLNVEDIGDVVGGLVTLMDLLPKKDNGIDLSGQSVDLTLDMKALYLGGNLLGNQKTKLSIEDGVLEAQNKGTITDGKVDWSAIVKPDGKTHRLDITARLDDLAVENLLETTTGKAQKFSSNVDAVIAMGANATEWDQFGDALSGRMTSVVDKGTVSAQLLNEWSNGLGPLLLPNFDPESDINLTCGVADFNIAKGQASIATLFLDSKRVLVEGTGGYDMNADQLNIALKPQPRGNDYSGLAATVRITGPAAEPRYRADLRAVTQKAQQAVVDTAISSALSFLNTGRLDLDKAKDEAKAKLKAEVAPPVGNPCTVLDGLSGNMAASVQAKLGQ